MLSDWAKRKKRKKSESTETRGVSNVTFSGAGFSHWDMQKNCAKRSWIVNENGGKQKQNETRSGLNK
jgi:hypothetical protein